MKIHHIRNATCVIETGSHVILIDPMLGEKQTLPSFSRFRYPSQKNPIVPLPDQSDKLLGMVTHCLITHSQKWGIEALTHSDHLDGPGKMFLKEKKIPVICLADDERYMTKNGISVESTLHYWKKKETSMGTVTAIPARHGHSRVSHLMANGAGYFIRFSGEPSVYISGDTVLTEDVKRALTELKPDISVIAAGSARLDIGDPILMSMDEIISFIKKSPGQVVANHMEALNHCPTTRDMLTKELLKQGLMDKTMIPHDGETLVFS